MNPNTAKTSDPIWDSRNSDEPTMPQPQLPGSQGNLPNPPPLVGTNISPEERARIDAGFKELATVKQALAAIMAIFDAHPELRGIVTGQGKTPP